MRTLLFLQNAQNKYSASHVERTFVESGLQVDYFWASKNEFPAYLGGYDGIYISGGPSSAYDDDEFIRQQISIVQEGRDRAIPVLGVCLGCQIAAAALLGHDKVFKRDRCEVGFKDLELLDAFETDELCQGINQPVRMFVWHNDDIWPDSSDMRILARSPDSEVQIWRYKETRIWGVQGHPEVPVPEHRAWFEEHRAGLEKDGADVAALIADGKSTAQAKKLVRRFARICIDTPRLP
jgi:GMP synthase-like glutamine amidotransferase